MKTQTIVPFKVRDLSLAEHGRAEIRLAEHEMPGLMALRREYRGKRPLEGARVSGSLHMTVQTAVLIETLLELGAQVRWCSCNIFSTQDHAAAAVAVGPRGTPDRPQGIAVYAWKGETLAEYWWCTEQALLWPDGEGCNLLLDDGGDATLMVVKGAQFERAGGVPEPRPDESEDWNALLDCLRGIARRDAGLFTRLERSILGVSEETTTGVHRLYRMQEEGTLPFPAINVNDSVTKSKFDNIYGCRHSLLDGLNRATGVMLGGKVAVVCGYGEVGKGCAQALRGQGCRVIVTEIDPICALQAAMEGFEVKTLDDAVKTADLFITATGNRDVITVDHMRKMKDKAIVGNIGHFDNEIDMAGPPARPGHPARDDQAPVRRVRLPGRAQHPRPRRGPPPEPRLRDRPPVASSCRRASRTRCSPRLELFTGTRSTRSASTCCRRHLDEHVARLHLDKLGVKLTKLTPAQAYYIGVPAEGPQAPTTGIEA